MQTQLLGLRLWCRWPPWTSHPLGRSGRNYQVEPRGPAYRCVSTTTLHLFRHRLLCRAPEPTAETWLGILDLPADLSEAVIIPHYEWQYHYVGRHAHWEGHQVLVMAPTQSARG